MIAVITGDVINSREGKVLNWLNYLKKILNHYGREPLEWEIFRGDSFQLSITPKNALLAAIHIKAGIKQTKEYDVRMAIGLGEETHRSKKITESNGSAYVLSGECFDSLKKQTLAIRSANQGMDKGLNLMLSLALLTANNWSSTEAKAITLALEHPDKNQSAIVKLLNKSQSSVSEALKRGGYDEIMNLNSHYQQQIQSL